MSSPSSSIDLRSGTDFLTDDELGDFSETEASLPSLDLGEVRAAPPKEPSVRMDKLPSTVHSAGRSADNEEDWKIGDVLEEHESMEDFQALSARLRRIMEEEDDEEEAKRQEEEHSAFELILPGSGYQYTMEEMDRLMEIERKLMEIRRRCGNQPEERESEKECYDLLTDEELAEKMREIDKQLKNLQVQSIRTTKSKDIESSESDEGTKETPRKVNPRDGADRGQDDDDDDDDETLANLFQETEV